MAGRWRMASVQMSFAIMPALVYWFAGLESSPRAATRSRSARWWPSPRLQTRLFFPIQSLLSVGIDIQTSLALFDRIFEYLDLPVDIAERADARRLEGVRGDVRLEGVWFRYGESAPWTLEDVGATIAAGTRTAIVGETGSGKTTLGYLVARLYDPQRGRVTIDGTDIRDVTLGRWRRPSGSSPRRPTCSTPASATTCASRGRRRPTRRSRPPRARPRSTT